MNYSTLRIFKGFSLTITCVILLFFSYIFLLPLFQMVHAFCSDLGGTCNVLNIYGSSCSSGYTENDNSNAVCSNQCVNTPCVCCIPNPTPTLPPSPSTCTDIGGYCSSPSQGGCGNTGYLDNTGNYDWSCQPPYTNQNFGYCCEPPDCGTVAIQNGASSYACVNNFRTCTNGHGVIAGGPGDFGCVTGICCLYYPVPTPAPPPICSSGTVCGSCGGAASNTCSNNGTQACNYTQTPICSISNIFNQSCTYNNCSATYSCNGGVCQAALGGTVYIDYDRDGNWNGSDTAFTGQSANVQVAWNGGSLQTPTNSSNGYWQISAQSNNYTMSVPNPPAGYSPGNSVNYSMGPANTNVNVGIFPLYSISGKVYNDVDNDNDNIFDAADLAMSNVTVKISGGPTLTTDANGNYNSGQVLLSGNYTVTVTAPSGYSFENGNSSYTVHVGPGCSVGGNPEATCGNPFSQSVNNLNFEMLPPYQISGKVYNDIDKDSYIDHTYDGPDTPISPSTSVRISGPTNLNLTTDASGNYTSGQVLSPGSYTVTATLPSGFSFINTYVGSYTVTVGNGCSVGGNPEASCGAPNFKSINNLNYATTNENSFPQPICGDGRFDTGYSQLIPSTANCNGTSGPYAIVSGNICPVNPGILYSGAVSPSYGGGLGPSAPGANSGQIVGDALFPETFSTRLPNTIQTSYSFVNTTITTLGIPSTPLASICPSLINCVLSENTPGGVYTTQPSDGPVSISISNGDGTFALGNTTYTFVIGGNLTFTSGINVSSNPIATGTAAFISGGDIHVSGNVGESDFSSVNPNLRGLFSADKNFYADALFPAGQQCQLNGQPKENKLNIKGSLIVNAAKNGGNIVDNRDGCLQDLSCPTITFTTDVTGLINIMGNFGNTYATGALKPPYSFWQELNP